jgi:hypothetical protein
VPQIWYKPIARPLFACQWPQGDGFYLFKIMRLRIPRVINIAATNAQK